MLRFKALLVLFLIALGGCATAPRYDVTVFHEWPTGLSQRTFQMAVPAGDQDSLQARTYRRIVRDELIAAGFVESDSPALQVSFEFDIELKQTRYIDPGPVFTPYFSLGHRHGWGGLHVSGPLWWGWPGSERVIDYHDHRLKLMISDLRGAQPRPVFEGSSRRRLNQPGPASVLAPLVRAILTDFPGESGQARRVQLADTVPAADTAPATPKPAK